jgi:hypothetical protein
MGRNIPDFQGGFEGFTHAYHVSPKMFRKSIETNGLDPARSGTYSFSDRSWLRGVFGHLHKEDVDPVYAEGWQSRSNLDGGDVYRYKLPKEGNGWDENSVLDSVRSRRKIPPKDVERVGHVTPYVNNNGEWSGGELHWHK